MSQAENVPVCVACRQKIPRGSAAGDYMTEGLEAERSVLSTESDLPQEIAPIAKSELRTNKYSIYPGDPARAEQLELLAWLEKRNRVPYADLRAEAERIAKHSELLSWLRESDRISDPDGSGRNDLVKQRRRGILRLLEGEDRGFPIHQPIPRYKLPQGQGFWLLRLQEELEWLSMIVLKPTIVRPYPRPIKDRLNHREARAIIDWKASRFDLWLSKNKVGGRITIDSSRGVLFDTDTFIRWIYSLMN